MAHTSGFRVTGYYDTDTPSAMPKNEIAEAASLLEHLLKDLDIQEKVDNNNIGAGDVSITPGPSSSTPFVNIRTENGEWIKFGERPVSLAPLAEIESHHLNTARVFEEATNKDPVLASMVHEFMIADIDKKAPVVCTSDLPEQVSRGFSGKDVRMLLKAKVIAHKHAKFALRGFKVAKKDPNLSRFITNCKPFNKIYSKFKGEKMNLPWLHNVMRSGARYSTVWSVDAKAYFFQFRLGRKACEWFPMRFKVGEQLVKVALRRLPMGFHLAPIIAQRTSNLIIQRVLYHMRRQSPPLEGDVVAWVDNFIVFAEDPSATAQIMEILERQLQTFDIACSPVDKSQEFLGLQKTAKGLALQQSHQDKLTASISEALNKGAPMKKELEQLAGRIMWLNHTISRRSLATMPATLELLRHIPTMASTDNFVLSGTLRHELAMWKADAGKEYILDNSAATIPIAWSDATNRRIAVVVESKVLIAETTNDVPIATMEALAAAWALALNKNMAHLRIDNMGVAYAFAKGHCKARVVNRILGKVFSTSVKGSIMWVPTADQVADGPTRDCRPDHTQRERERWKHLNSMFFTLGSN